MKKIYLIFSLLLAVQFFSQKNKMSGKSWEVQKIKYDGVFYEYFDAAESDVVNVVYFAPTEMQSDLRDFIRANTDQDSTAVFNMPGEVAILTPDNQFDWFQEDYAYLFQLPLIPRTLYYELSKNSSNEYQLVTTETTTGNQIYYELKDFDVRKSKSKRSKGVRILTVGEITSLTASEEKKLARKNKSVYRSPKREEHNDQNLLNYLPKHKVSTDQNDGNLENISPKEQ